MISRVDRAIGCSSSHAPLERFNQGHGRIAQLAASLSKNASTKDAGEELLQSIAGLQVAQAATLPDEVTNNVIEHLTEQLAALCLEHLEGGVNVSASNTNKEMDVKVRDKH